MATLHKQYGTPYYDEVTKHWNQRYDYVDENGKVWGIGSVDKARSLDLLDSVLTEDYRYGKPIGAGLNAISWGLAGASYLGIPGAVAGGLLGAANGYTGLPGMLLSNEGIRAWRSLDNLKINGVNVNPVEYEDPAAQLRAYRLRKDLLKLPNAKPNYQTPEERKAARHGKANAVEISLPSEPFNGTINIDGIPKDATYSVGMQNALKTPATSSKTPTAPTSDVITAKDGHLIGFAERHGLGWRDVWELNKETIPNPNAVQAGTTLNLPNRPAVSAAPTQAAPSHPATTQRRALSQDHFRSDARFKDYVSAQSQPAAKSTRSRTAKGGNLDINLLDKPSANLTALRDYGVTLGGSSPANKKAQEDTPLISGGAELAAMAARSRQMAAQEARQQQAAEKAAAKVETKANADLSARLAKEEKATVSPQRTASVEKLGDSAALTSGGIDAGDDQSTQTGAASRTADAHARADAANTAKARGAARHEAATKHADGITAKTYGKNGNVKDKDDKSVGVGFDRFGRATSVGGEKVKANQTNKARNKNGSYSFDSEGNGAGNAGGTVICTELYRQGLIEKDVYRADQRFGLRLMRNDPDVITGYQFWAKPVVRLMRKSRFFTLLVYKSVGEAWANDMARREGLNGFGTVRGILAIAVGIPVCRMIGRVMAACQSAEEKLV